MATQEKVFITVENTVQAPVTKVKSKSMAGRC